MDRETVAEQYRRFGVDPYKTVVENCWQPGCRNRVEVAFVDATIGRIYCEVHTVIRGQHESMIRIV